MKLFWIAAIPLAFASGIITTVALQHSGWIYLTGVSKQVAPPGAQPEHISAITTDRVQPVNDSEIAELKLKLTQFQTQLETATLDRESIRSELDTLREFSTDLHVGDLPPSDVRSENSAPNTQRQTIANRNNRRGFGGIDSQQQYDGLVAAGVDQTTASEIKQRTDQWALKRLDLIDTASREGWRDTDEFTEKLSALREQQVDIRAEIGDEAFDSYLFASGENNRVQIESVIDGSAAQSAGVVAGDIVVSYAEASVYQTRELARATRDGTRSESISLVVLREGEYLDLVIPRGPLGVGLRGFRQSPQENL
ncbi:hypothetical protein AB833_23485 [Chromatiales bacterium (ex Bugula neritina AB1)]|nr:hypothetical protein AB833_23485 [Chromatiales bacterium (ex Bugula neritina AB1)]